MSDKSKARYIMIGGFLGAGKSTSILKLARFLSGRSQRVSLITNDQGEQLVDTAFLASGGFSVEEIAGGCFCCRFNSLVDAAEKLTEETRPDVFIAEPVGSCTDLVATVSYPLRRIYGDNFSIAPLSVLVDPIRALRILDLQEGRRFSEKVIYVYRKQLEEADIIVINKSDLVTPEQIELLRGALAVDFPGAQTRVCSARQESGLLDWFEEISSTEQSQTATMEVDYQLYGEGEALLGWLNATVNLSAQSEWDGNEIISRLCARIKENLVQQEAEIAHLKMTLSPDENIYGDLAVVNLVRNDYEPELSQSLPAHLTQGQLIINLRAESEPETLHDAVKQAIAQFGENEGRALTLALDHLEFFKPGQPTPVHREVVAA